MKKFVKFALAVLCFCQFGLTISCQTKEQSANSVLQECQAFLSKDDLKGASACYQKAMLANPDSGEQISTAGKSAIFKKCVDFKDNQDIENAIICFEGLTELKPNSANVYFNLADIYYKYYKQNIEKYKKKDLELLGRAETAVKLGLEIKSEDIPARVLYLGVLIEAEKFQEALKQAHLLVESDPKSSLFWTNLGFLQEKTNEDNKAIKSFQKAIEIKVNNITALYFLGELYQKMDKTNEAIEIFEKIVEINPNYDDTNQRLEYLKHQLTQKKKQVKAKSAGN